MLEWALILAGILFAAFHSGSETGTYCVNRLRLRMRAEQGLASARALLDFTRRPRLAISTILIGTNVGVYIATVLSAQKLNELLSGAHAELYSGLIMPPILLVCADFLPKSLFQHHADGLMYRAIWPLRISQKVFYPFAQALRWLGGLPQMLLGKGTAAPARQFSREAFRYYLSQGAAHGVLSSFQRSVADNVLSLKSLEVAKAMTPLENVVMVPEDATPEQVRETFAAHRYSRIPIYSGTREKITGVVRVMDLALAEANGAESARELLSVRRTASVADVLWTLRQARQQLAVVTDREGRALGIVTVKDLLEEIVGELEGL